MKEMKKIQLTKRLQQIVDYVEQGEVVADVGTDHGYIPIYLAQNNLSKTIYAMDINDGPLEKAEDNIKAYHVEEYIHTILSNGLLNFPENKLDTIIIAGMGGILIEQILMQSKQLLTTVKKLILSPHLDVERVRNTVHQLGFAIEIEDMVKEEQKYYPILVCLKGKERYSHQLEYKYGKIAIQKNKLVLKEYLEHKKESLQKVITHLEENNSSVSLQRKKEINKELEMIDEVISCL